MLQRCVSILVLVGFAIGQLANVPHAHASHTPRDQREHDAHPHIHLDWPHHAHSHSHAHTNQSHHSQQRETGVRPSCIALGGICGELNDHDETALYLPVSALSISAASERYSTNAAPLVAIIPESFLSARPTLVCDICSLHPPDRAAVGKLFLKLRHLRI